VIHSVKAGLVSAALLFAGCGSSGGENPPETKRTEYVFVNARNVERAMETAVEHNAAAVCAAIKVLYGRFSRMCRVEWNDDDSVVLRYRQDYEINTSRKPPEGVAIFTSIGNDKDESVPELIGGASKGDMVFDRATVQVLNAMHGEKAQDNDALRLHINNTGNYETQLLALGETVGRWVHIAGGMNSLVEVKNRRGISLLDTTENIENGRAYLFVIYENELRRGEPEVMMVDVTP